ncbi:DUF397 domain-containing protein [Streptomyces ficellus]|uniref:DUF397 domain-containing protein n=1 Tax=Streptomyces ficellus TaxID=1977088 RepID=A0A6I6FTH3_9ACTN|nr:DUF397 domain-containing protein [Streptomyces ficellus]QGV80436.1 DUF397 domain-containing protein [Streptomyces ficellus]
MTDEPDLRWFTSSYSGGSGTECVECAEAAPLVLVRDSKQRGGPILAVPDRTWRSFIGWVGAS